MSIHLDKSLRHLVLILTALLLLFEVANVQAQAQVGYLPPEEVNVLREIAQQLGKTDWNFSLNPCDNNSNWATPKSTARPLYNNTVVCDCSYPGDVCHVIYISLKGQDLKGVLPPSLAKLPYIKRIDLARNYLNGTIPPEWASTNLEYLSAIVNRLSGRIPTYLGNITSLVYLSLESNMFSGTVPAELGKLENLKNLVLNANNLSGELPVELNNLRNLEELRLSSNSFTGKIPSLESWKELRMLEMHASGMEGPIPASISFLSKLEELISDLSGEGSPRFPDLIGMKNIKKLMLRSCNITGTVPDYLSQMSKLKHLDLSFNHLYGTIPDLSGQNDLQNMYLTGNFLNGTIPRWFIEGDNTRNRDLSYNRFSETSIPTFCYESRNLFRSYIGANESDIAKCLNRCFKDYKSVHINCGGTKITTVDKTYEADQDIAGAAKFYHSNDSWGFSSTGTVDLDKKIYNAYKYTANNVSILTMEDSELYTVARLSPLSITYYGRCLANGRYTVTLHFAEIVIRANESYQSLGRRIFDVYVQGTIYLKDFDITKEAGGVDKAVIKRKENVLVTNNTLEIRFQYAGKGTTVAPMKGVFGPLISAISMESDFEPSNRSTFIAIGAVASVLCLVLVVLGISWQRGYIWNQISRKKELEGLDLQTGAFTYRQIKAATNNFADSNKLGEGGFGPVYKGALLDGTLIAVKQLSSKSKQGNREFVNEIGMIAGIRHPNVVRLHGCCVERKHLLLVYEYMENNSLAHALFEQDNTTTIQIDWPTRQRICIGVAKGLAFLHEESVIKMVHRDIKATNVLLDRDLTPKISDFGLAKLTEEENTHITTKVAGTIGYMAPEYALRGTLTYKADVYSFGVLALEIVAGKSNMKFRPNGDFICLLDWAVDLKERESLMDLVDPRLGNDLNKTEALRMVDIALLCTQKIPTLRPTMSEVVNMLEGTTKIMEPGIFITSSDDEYRLQALRMLDEVEYDEHVSFRKPTSSSSHDLYPKSQISYD
uniref:probable leucine-rich repeat receptor-like serine/threonine-protein kinase At3g14840 isoform X2 n=1 Tax=Erigeron canadensis TaxID=72917 RepID=UPI001CB96504|nr:probable leucine-rich repeat receptor-like serine/threonine-protein kinase At3g14840 isoform X2 [Erigeron canadensis]